MNETPRTLKDAAYIAVGFGVLAYQRAQVARQDLLKQGGVEDRLQQIERGLESVQQQLESVLDDIEEQLDRVLDEVQGRLPEQASDLLRTARSAAKDASGQLRELSRSARASRNKAA